MASYKQYEQLGKGGSDSLPADGMSNGQTETPAGTGSSSEMAPPQLGATFVPGGWDDYYMPEVVAPSPQRVTPQVPQNMQEDLQRMELEAISVEPPSSNSNDNDSTTRRPREPSLSTYINPKVDSGAPLPKPPKVSDDDITPYQSSDKRTDRLETMNWDAPSFSPFPKVKGDNVPPTDEDKEEILWNARKHVLHSQNVSMQITWARDVLTWAEIAQDAVARDYGTKDRPATPRIEHELRLDAINIISYLAQQDHPEALYMRSKWVEFGKFGNRVDKRDAYVGYKRAAELGHGRSEYRMGMLYEQSNDMSKAKEHYYRGLSLKDSASLYRMGMMSLLGQHGETKDYPTGLERIQAAADSSDEDAPQGAYVYGMLVGRDLPDISVPEGLLPTNLQSSKMYIEKAAYLGFAKAQLKMGQAYELCQLTCDFNPSYSLHYYGLAAKQGSPEAALGVSRWFLFGYEGVFKKNEQLAYKYAQEAAAAKLPTGEFAMGYYHEIGIHVEKSLNEARKWYQLAADHGNKDALARLDSLSQDKTLSKTDHETTTLTRIKSQHGSQRGKRPDRFKQPQQMPTLSESGSNSPVNDEPPILKPKSNPASPRLTPSPSPGIQPTIVSEHVQFPDPSRASFVLPAVDRAPAFTLRLDNDPPTARSKSTAPYPDDDRPPPLAIRPKSTAPYPEDDVRGPTSPQSHLGVRPIPGPHADRPGSAFGIRPPTGGPRPMPSSQSLGNLQPHGPRPDPRGRVASAGWDPQGPGGYGGRGGPGNAPGPGGPGRGRPSPYPEDDGGRGRGQPYPGQGPPGGPGGPGGRGQKPVPGVIPPAGTYGNQPPRGGSPGAGAGYGPRTSSRPNSGGVPGGNAPPQNYERFSRVPGAAGRPERMSSLPPGQQQGGQPNRPPQQQQPQPPRHDSRPDSRPGPGPQQNSRPDSRPDSRPSPQKQQQPPPQKPQQPPQGRPPMASGGGGPGRADSAPPTQLQRPPENKPSPAPSVASAATAPPKTGKGPATFEDMGIPQGKQEGDCVVM